MSPTIIRGVRHTGVVATLGPHGYKPYRAARDARHNDCGSTCSCRRPSPTSKRSGATDTAAKLVTTMDALAHRIAAVGTKFAKMSDSLDGAAHNARQIADQRRAVGHQGRV